MLKIIVGSDISLIKYKLFGKGYIYSHLSKKDMEVENVFIQSLSDLWQNLSESLFLAFEDKKEKLLVRFEKDSEIAGGEKILGALQASSKEFYIVFDSLLAKDKQTLKKWLSDIEILEYKKPEETDKQEVLDIFLDFTENHTFQNQAQYRDEQADNLKLKPILKPLKLKKPQVKKIFETYQSPVDMLDFLDILQIIQNSMTDFDKVFDSFFVSEIELFKLGFVSQSQILSWYKRLNLDDLQMILSLIFGKIERSSIDDNRKKQLQKTIIQTDWKLKTQKNHIALVKYALIQALNII
jgi:hypothetical protein